MTNAYLEGHQLTILGDLNIDLLQNRTSSKAWLTMNEKLLMYQVVNEPTRVTDPSTTMIDHIFTSHMEKVRAIEVPKVGLNDHYPTCIVLKERFGNKHSHTCMNYRSFRNFDQRDFLNDLQYVHGTN